MCFLPFYALHKMLCAYTRARGDRPFCGWNSFFHLGPACAPERDVILVIYLLGTDMFVESSPEFSEWQWRSLSWNLGSKAISIIVGTGRKSKLIFLMDSYIFLLCRYFSLFIFVTWMICISFCKCAKLAHDAVLICHGLSLAPGFRGSDDFKFSSLQHVPTDSCLLLFTPLYRLSPHVRVGLCEQQPSDGRSGGVTSEVTLRKSAFCPGSPFSSPLLDPSFWAKPAGEQPCGEASVVRNPSPFPTATEWAWKSHLQTLSGRWPQSH